MTASDTAPNHRADGMFSAPGMANTSRANHQNPVMTFPIPVAILGVITSLRTRTADRDVPRETREKQ
jgi:hypothetical protein